MSAAHLAAKCAPGKKAKATLTDLVCDTSATEFGTCGNCCEADTTTCGGTTVTFTCDSSMYKDTGYTGKGGAAAGADATTAKAACCTAQATRDTHTCSTSVAHKLKSTASSLKCAMGTCATSDESTCCEADTTKCGGASITCPTGTFAKAATTVGTTEAACCTAKAACDANACAAGYKLKTNAASMNFTTETCSTSDQSTCCEKDDTKCGGQASSWATSVCDSGMYLDSTKNGVTGNTSALCCTAKATCAGYACSSVTPILMTLKTAAATTHCTGASATCTASTCCDVDTTKCGGATVTCDSNQYKDQTKYGTAAGSTADAMKAACCTAKATCTAFIAAGKTGLTSGGQKPQPLHVGLILAMASGMALLK